MKIVNPISLYGGGEAVAFKQGMGKEDGTFPAGSRRALIKTRVQVFEEADSWTNSEGWAVTTRLDNEVYMGSRLVGKGRLEANEVNEVQWGQEIDENLLETNLWNEVDIKWNNASQAWNNNFVNREGKRSEEVVLLYLKNHGPGDALISLRGEDGVYGLQTNAYEGIVVRGADSGSFNSHDIWIKPVIEDDEAEAVELTYAIMRK
jgi:hypothetical protein